MFYISDSHFTQLPNHTLSFKQSECWYTCNLNNTTNKNNYYNYYYNNNRLVSLWCSKVWLTLDEIYLCPLLLSVLNHLLLMSVSNIRSFLLIAFAFFLHFASRPQQQVTQWPHRACPPDGKRERTQREELTMSTTTTVPPHGRGQSCRYISMTLWNLTSVFPAPHVSFYFVKAW